MNQEGTQAPGRYHRIKALSIKGGFLNGSRFEFDENLNCIIGGRGTGKTTVLEFIRWALDRMPDPNQDRDRFQHIKKLIDGNLHYGSVELEVETVAGIFYTVKRSLGDDPVVFDGQGEATQITIGRSQVFDADIFSQNEIEDIADNDYFQLLLIDKFVEQDVKEVEESIRELSGDLHKNASEILRYRQDIGDLTEAIRELPDVTEKLKGYAVTGDDERSATIRKEQELSDRRKLEIAFLESLQNLYEGIADRIETTSSGVIREFENTLNVDLSESPNREIVEQARKETEKVQQLVEQHLNKARIAVIDPQAGLSDLKNQLSKKHQDQNEAFQKLFDAYEEERGKERERSQLQKRQMELKKKESALQQAEAKYKKALDERRTQRARLSELRDKRYQLRLGVAEGLNEKLSPMIRIKVEPYGNMDEYRNILNSGLKGSGLKYTALVDRIIERIPPTEFSIIVQNNDQKALEDQLEIDADRAARIIIQFKDSPQIYEIETVELYDKPVIELKDGPDYKDSASLSTGQKCTTILPILLLESERPLIIDQPEDNLDNAFVYDTIVRSIKGVRDRRQLIFVTHNPNIPVLGEADRVFVLHSSGRSANIQNKGPVDAVRDDIETILEGGAEAFKLRMERYGY